MISSGAGALPLIRGVRQTEECRAYGTRHVATPALVRKVYDRLMRHQRCLGVLASLFCVVVLSPLAAAARAEGEEPTCGAPAPLKEHSEGIPHQWLVVYKKSVTDPGRRTDELTQRYGFATRRRWKTAIKGFSAELPPDTVRQLRCEEGVDFIEQDQKAIIAH